MLSNKLAFFSSIRSVAEISKSQNIQRRKKMGRHRKKQGRKRLEILSPIQEMSGESRSPTPVGDVDVTGGCGPVTKPDKKMQSLKSNEMSQKTTDKPSGDFDLFEEKDIQKPDTDDFQEHETSQRETIEVENSADSFLNHLMSLVEEYQRDMMKMGRQLSQEREINAKIREEAKKNRLDYYNYRLSWEIDQAEIQKLNCRVRCLELENLEIKNKLKQVEEEHEKIKKSRSKSLDEQMPPRPIINTTFTAQTDNHTKGSVSDDNNGTTHPKIPVSVKHQRRPYTGKSRNPNLPPISENNKVSSSMEQTTPKPSHSSRSVRSPTSLPSIQTPNRSIVPHPPPHPRQSLSRRHSKLPMATEAVRGASSAGNVPHQSDEERGQKYGRCDRNKQ